MSHAVPVITPENVVVLVRMYFESQERKENVPNFMKYMLHWKCKANITFNELGNKNLYNVFWAIRVLADHDHDQMGKYDFDDIEFHVRRNPIFAEINPERNPEEEIEPKQLGILRHAIHKYQAEKKETQ